MKTFLILRAVQDLGLQLLTTDNSFITGDFRLVLESAPYQDVSSYLSEAFWGVGRNEDLGHEPLTFWLFQNREQRQFCIPEDVCDACSKSKKPPPWHSSNLEKTSLCKGQKVPINTFWITEKAPYPASPGPFHSFALSPSRDHPVHSLVVCSTQLPATVSLCMELTVLEALARKSYPAARGAPKLPAGSVSGNPKDGIWLALGPSSWPRQAEPEDQGQEPSSACADTERSHR